jgi:hypothetical protein
MSGGQTAKKVSQKLPLQVHLNDRFIDAVMESNNNQLQSAIEIQKYHLPMAEA